MRAVNRVNLARMFYLVCLSLIVGESTAQNYQGVSKSELVVGTIQDLSGPTAAYGRQLRNGLQMRANELNQQGGINGRRIKLVVEDSSGDPARAAVAVSRLIGRDHVFAVLGQMGGPQNLAAMPAEFEGNVINFLPLTGERAMYDPPSRLKVAFWPSYLEQIKTGILYLAQRKKVRKPCLIVQDDDFGGEVLDGTLSALQTLNLPPAEKVMVRRGATDSVGVLEKIRSSGCDLVALGISIRDSLNLVAEAHRVGFAPDFVGTSALYGAYDQSAAARAGDGLYAVHTVSQPYRDDASKLVRDWAAAYASEFKEDPAIMAVYGYYIMDLFGKAAAKAGPILTLDSFENVLEATTFPRDIFGSPEFHVTATDRLGSRKVRISEIVNGRWTPVTTLLDVQPVSP